MVKEAPSFGRIFGMLAFTASCVGILLYLWLTFGGAIPLRPEGYRLHVKFPEATQLAQEADVRISGVNVGKVKIKTPGHGDRPDRRRAGAGREVRAAALGREGRAAPEDAAWRDLRGAEPGQPRRAEARRRRHCCRGPGVAHRRARRDLPHLRSQDEGRVHHLDGPAGTRVNKGGKALNDALAVLTPFAEDVDAVLRILDDRRRRRAASYATPAWSSER